MKNNAFNPQRTMALDMAEWKHKEDRWKARRMDTKVDDTGNVHYHHHGWRVEDGVPTFIHYMDAEEYEENGELSFTDWLDLLCSGGWEVLNIEVKPIGEADD